MREKGHFYSKYYIVYKNITYGVTLKHNLNGRDKQFINFSIFLLYNRFKKNFFKHFQILPDQPVETQIVNKKGGYL